MSRIARVPRQPGKPGADVELVPADGALSPSAAPQPLPVAFARASAFGAPLPPDAPLSRYLEVLKRRWVLGALLFVVVVGGITVGALLRTPVYRASALMEIRPDSAGAVPVEALFSTDKVPTDELETQYGILKSRTLAERVILDVRRYAAPGRKPTPGATAGTTGTGRPVAAVAVDPDQVDSFLGTLVVNPKRGSRLVEIQYVSPYPRQAAFTVNSVLDNYLKIRMDEAQRSAEWLQEQIKEAQRRLEASERQIQAYVRQHGIQAIETGKGETAALANERLKTLREALAEAQAVRMDKQSADEETRRAAATAGVDSEVTQQLTVRLADLRREHAKLATSFKEDYPALAALTQQIAQLEQALAQETRMVIARGQREYQAALGKETLLARALAEQSEIVRELSEGSAGNAGYEALKRELVTNQEQFKALGQKLKEVRISAALKAANVGVIDRATPPDQPDGIPLPLTIALAAMVGLVVAGAGIVVREQFDTSMRSFNDVESQLGVRTLAAIPAVGRQPRVLPMRDVPERRTWKRIDDHGAQRSALADAFAALRNAVILQENDGASRVLLITSTQSAEGKTTVSVNLALSLARLRHRVLLVDGNMRFPCIQRALGLPDRPGLVEHLVSGTDWRSSLHVQVRPNLDVLAGGEPQASPADLLSMPAIGELFEAASREYDFVIVDSPAVLPHLADVRSLAAVVDNVLFIIRHGSTPRESVALALSQLDHVAGVVLNRSENAEGVLDQPDFARKATV